MSTATIAPSFDPARQLQIARRAIAKRSFCVLATSSASNRPHSVGVMYVAVGLDLYIITGAESVKVRNIRENPRVAVCVPVRKYPGGPPMAVQFQGTAELLAPDDPQITQLLASGQLKKIARFLRASGVCCIKITPQRRISTYGLGISLLRLLRDVSRGERSVPIG